MQLRQKFFELPVKKLCVIFPHDYMHEYPPDTAVSILGIFLQFDQLQTIGKVSHHRDNISVVPCNGFVQFFIFRINSVVRCINELFAYAFICIVHETLVPAPFLNFLLYIHLLDI